MGYIARLSVSRIPSAREADPGPRNAERAGDVEAFEERGAQRHARIADVVFLADIMLFSLADKRERRGCLLLYLVIC